MVIEKVEEIEIIEMTTSDGKVYRRYSEYDWCRYVFCEERMVSISMDEELEQFYQEFILTK